MMHNTIRHTHEVTQDHSRPPVPFRRNHGSWGHLHGVSGVTPSCASQGDITTQPCLYPSVLPGSTSDIPALGAAPSFRGAPSALPRTGSMRRWAGDWARISAAEATMVAVGNVSRVPYGVRRSRSATMNRRSNECCWPFSCSRVLQTCSKPRTS